MRRTLATGVLSCGLFAGLLTGCTFSAHIGKKDAVSKDDVSRQISEKMTDDDGNKPESVSCPGDLKAKVGATLDCQMDVKGQTYGVNVTVTSVDGDNVKFDMVVTLNKDEVADEVGKVLSQQLGRAPDNVTCPENLKGKQGATLQCEFTEDGQTYGVTVTVTSVKGSVVNFDVRPDTRPK